MNIYVKAYLDMNYGDDLMLCQMAETLDPSCMIYVHCEAHLIAFYEQLLQPYKNVKLVQCPLRRIHRYGKGFFSAVILLGGSVLMGNRYRGCWYRFLNIIYLAFLKRYGTEYIIVGCNVGPFKNKFTEFWVRKEIKRAVFITARDQTSFQYLMKSARKTAHVHYFPDMLMQIAQTCKISASPCANRLGIAVHGPSGAALNTFLTELCEEYIDKTQQPVTLLCFDTGTQNDIRAAQSIYSGIHRKDMVRIESHCAEPYYLLRQMAECSRIVAVRFHAAVLAISLDIPFLPIAYSNKMQLFLYDIGQTEKGYSVSSVARQSPAALLEALMKDPVVPKADWGLLSREHFHILAGYLNGKGAKDHDKY
jgi:polysaccharide pyruvyl transferase WcaK-like protein